MFELFAKKELILTHDKESKMKHTIIVSVILGSIFFTGCSYRNIWQATPNENCIGAIDVPQSCVKEISDSTLIKKVVLQKDSGGICKGVVFEVTKPIVVYRIWNSKYPDSRLKNWWTFDKPVGTLESYRENYEICCQWGPRDTMEICTLKVNSKIVVGPGQSINCKNAQNYNDTSCCDTSYNASPRNQVYVNDPQNSLKGCCSAKAPWLEQN